MRNRILISSLEFDDYLPRNYFDVVGNFGFHCKINKDIFYALFISLLDYSLYYSRAAHSLPTSLVTVIFKAKRSYLRHDHRLGNCHDI